MKKILVDTDILIDFSKGFSQSLEKLLRQQSTGQAELFVSPVNIAEYFTDKNLNNATQFSQATEFMGLFSIREITKKIGLIAGELLRQKKIEFLGDALVAATCLSEKLQLATRNHKHFSKVEGLRLIDFTH